MVSFKPVAVILAAACLVPTVVLAAPTAELGDLFNVTDVADQLEARQGGYYFSSWSEGGTNVKCNNGGGGSYTVSWSGKGGFVCGKGWQPGGSR